jgi:hypothetical protein
MATINAIGSQDPIQVTFGGTGDATITGLLSGNGTGALVPRTITGTTNSIAVATGDGSTGNPTISLSPTVVKSSQPAFLAYMANTVSNVTGDTTSYTVVFDTKSFDQGTNYNTGNGVFTAPTTGLYYFCVTTTVTGLTSAYAAGLVQYRIVTTNRSYEYVAGITTNFSSTGRISYTLAVLANMTATHTASILINLSGSTKTIGVYGNAVPESWFSGYLVA